MDLRVQKNLMKRGQGRDKGLTSDQIEENFRSELADVLGHVLLLTRHHKVSLDEAVEAKWLAWLPADLDASRKVL